MLKGPIFLTLLSLAWPNLVMMLAQSSTGFIEAWFLSKLGLDALAGAALVLPILMLMQSMSQGAMGGGISSAVARALGAGNVSLANSLALHAVVLNTLLGIICSTLLIIFSAPLFQLMGAQDGTLEAALAYAQIAFPGLILMWIMNALASVIRGSGNMFTPGIVMSGGAVLLVPLSPLLIFGWGHFPALGIAGAGWALVAYRRPYLASYAQHSRRRRFCNPQPTSHERTHCIHHRACGRLSWHRCLSRLWHSGQTRVPHFSRRLRHWSATRCNGGLQPGRQSTRARFKNRLDGWRYGLCRRRGHWTGCRHLASQLDETV